jgi:hypothetical protein
MAGISNQVPFPAELHFGIGLASVTTVNQAVGHLRPTDAPFAPNAAFSGPREVPLDIRGSHVAELARVTLVVLDPAHHRVMGSPVDMDVSRVVSFAYVVVIIDDRIVDHGR